MNGTKFCLKSTDTVFSQTLSICESSKKWLEHGERNTNNKKAT